MVQRRRSVCILVNRSAFHDAGMSAADTAVTTTRINAALRARLDALARATKRSKSFLTVEAIAAYVELNEGN